jgi:hypothetical protein
MDFHIIFYNGIFILTCMYNINIYIYIYIAYIYIHIYIHIRLNSMYTCICCMRIYIYYKHVLFRVYLMIHKNTFWTQQLSYVSFSIQDRANKQHLFRTFWKPPFYHMIDLIGFTKFLSSDSNHCSHMYDQVTNKIPYFISWKQQHEWIVT